MARIGDREVDVPRVVVAGVAIVLLVTVGYAASTSGAAFGLYNPQWDGTADLRAEADAVGTEPTVLENATAYDGVQSNGTVAFVLSPAAPYGEDDAARIASFVRSGGTLVIADRGGAGNDLLSALDAESRFAGPTLRDDRSQYRSPALPVAPHVGNHSLVAGTSGLTLNYGTAVRPGNATVLVESSGYAYLDRDGDESPGDDEVLRRRPVATAESIGDGTVVAVGDSSVFINAMLDRPGNGRFARTLLASHDRAVFDYSHGRSLPPLAALLTAVRQSPLLQLLVGLGAVGLLLAIEQRWAGRLVVGLSDLRDRFGRRGSGSPSTGEQPVDHSTMEAGAVAATLRARHPNWDDERIQRVAEALADQAD